MPDTLNRLKFHYRAQNEILQLVADPIPDEKQAWEEARRNLVHTKWTTGGNDALDDTADITYRSNPMSRQKMLAVLTGIMAKELAGEKVHVQGVISTGEDDQFSIIIPNATAVWLRKEIPSIQINDDGISAGHVGRG